MVLEAPPAIKVIPKVVEPLDLLLRRIVVAQHWHRLLLAEPRLALEHWAKVFEEVRVGVFRGLDQLLGRYVVLEGLVVGVDGIELSAPLGVREDLHRFLYAFEERVVVRLACAGLLVRVVFKHFLAVWVGGVEKSVVCRDE